MKEVQVQVAHEVGQEVFFLHRIYALKPVKPLSGVDVDVTTKDGLSGLILTLVMPARVAGIKKWITTNEREKTLQSTWAGDSYVLEMRDGSLIEKSAVEVHSQAASAIAGAWDENNGVIQGWPEGRR